MKNNRRKEYLINKPLQFKMILFLSLMVLGVILVAHGLSLGFSEMFISRSSAAAGHSINLGFNLDNFFEILWMPLLISMILGLIFVLIFGLLYSHRIAGPLYNLKGSLMSVQYGDLSVTMRIRRHDELHDMETAFNQMTDSLHEKVSKIKSACARLPVKDKRVLEQIINEEFKLRYEQD